MELYKLFEDTELEIAQLEHERDSVNSTLNVLRSQLQDLCGRLGHDWEEGQCVLCQLVDERDLVDYAAELNMLEE